jgi:hypothetical protein
LYGERRKKAGIVTVPITTSEVELVQAVNDAGTKRLAGLAIECPP